MSDKEMSFAYCGGDERKCSRHSNGSETRAAEWLRGLCTCSFKVMQHTLPPPPAPLPLLSILTSTSFTNGGYSGILDRTGGSRGINRLTLNWCSVALGETLLIFQCGCFSFRSYIFNSHTSPFNPFKRLVEIL